MPLVKWTDPVEERFISWSALDSSLHTLNQRDTVNVITSCRSTTNDDLRGLNDAQLQVFLNNMPFLSSTCPSQPGPARVSTDLAC